MRFVHLARQIWLGTTSRSASHYWERRYRAGMDSGAGSSGELAAFKARALNELVRAHGIRSVIELGCGDGRQLALAEYPSYLGFDVSKTAIDLCARRFGSDPTKSFLWYDPACSVNLANFLRADLVLSLDVIYHLLEDDAYRRYLRDLFSMARRFAVIYSSDREPERTAAHVRHRRFTDDVRRDYPAFRLLERVPNPRPDRTFADFYIYQRDEG